MSRPRSTKRRKFKSLKGNAHQHRSKKEWTYDGTNMSFDQAHRGCMDKTRFHSRKTVRSAARRLKMHYYKCPFCGDFHLTKSKGAINPWKE